MSIYRMRHARENPISHLSGKVLKTRDGSSIMVVAGHSEHHPYSVVRVKDQEATSWDYDTLEEARREAERLRVQLEAPRENPYHSEHSARQHSPRGYKSCGRKSIMSKGRPLTLLICSPTGDRGAHDTEVASVRFPVEYWSPAEAKRWLRDHGFDDSQFEEAE